MAYLASSSHGCHKVTHRPAFPKYLTKFDKTFCKGGRTAAQFLTLLHNDPGIGSGMNLGMVLLGGNDLDSAAQILHTLLITS